MTFYSKLSHKYNHEVSHEDSHEVSHELSHEVNDKDSHDCKSLHLHKHGNNIRLKKTEKSCC